MAEVNREPLLAVLADRSVTKTAENSEIGDSMLLAIGVFDAEARRWRNPLFQSGIAVML